MRQLQFSIYILFEKQVSIMYSLMTHIYMSALKRKDGAPGWCFLTVSGKLLSICQVYDIFYKIWLNQ